MVFPAFLLVNAALGVLGIGFGLQQRDRSRLVSWLMIGSGIVLCSSSLGLMIVTSAFSLPNGSLASSSFVVYVPRFLLWMMWPAYALLLFGFVHRTPGKVVLETAGGGVVAAITGGHIGLLVARAIGGSWSDAAEGEIVKITLGIVVYTLYGAAGATAGMMGGVAGVLHAYRSDIGARRRFWFTVLAALFGALLWFLLKDLFALQLFQHSGHYYQDVSRISAVASVFPLMCGMVGYLLGLLSDDPATRGHPAHKRRRLVSVCLLLALLATATLPFLVCGTR
jgi:hypothetical protein